MSESLANEIKVSVIMPVYNVEEYLGECLDSVLGQTLQEIEVVCVDDGSTDSSVKILEEYRSRDPRVKVYRQQNAGAGEARNNALRHASGEFIAFMDADDRYPDNEVLEKLVSAAERHSVKIAGGSKLRETAKGIRPKKTQTFTQEEVIEYKDFQKDYDYQCYIFERKLLAENNITFPYYRRYQDPPFFIRAMVAAEKFCAIPDATYVYRVDPNHVKWNELKTEHLIRAITECLQLSSENHLPKLHYQTVKRLEKEYRTQIKENCSRSVISALMDAEKTIDAELLREGCGEEMEFSGEYRLALLDDMLSACRNSDELLEELKKTKKELAKIKNSRSYKILKFIRR